MRQRCGTEKVQKQKDAEIKKDRRLIAVLEHVDTKVKI